MSWKICYPSEQPLSGRGVDLIRCAVAEYEGYTPDTGGVIPLTEESDLIVVVLRQGNACQKGAVDSLAAHPVPEGDGYLLAVRPHPFFEGRTMILIASETDEGLLKGCTFFTEEYLPDAARASAHGNPFRDGFAEDIRTASGQ